MQTLASITKLRKEKAFPKKRYMFKYMICNITQEREDKENVKEEKENQKKILICIEFKYNGQNEELKVRLLCRSCKIYK